MLLLPIAYSLCVPLATAQTNVGDLLDVGAKPISIEEFKRDIVQRVVAGPTAAGGTLEIMYASNGSVAGTGSPLYVPSPILGRNAPVAGEWTIDDNGRVCTSLRLGQQASLAAVTLPPRCQVWFKYGNDYFIADSDSDRLAKVLRRTVKQ